MFCFGTLGVVARKETCLICVSNVNVCITASMLICAGACVCVEGGWAGGGYVCLCVHALSIVSIDKILCFINTLITIIY